MAVRPDRVSQLPDAFRSVPGQHGHRGVVLRESDVAMVREVLVKILANPALLRAMV